MKILIKEGIIINSKLSQEKKDILVDKGRIRLIDFSIPAKGVDKVIQAKGKIVIPGLLDMHVHLREPGREDKETIETGTNAAIAGGITAVLAMPNTEPAIDSPEQVRLLQRRIEEKARVDVYIAAAITKKREGRELTDFKSLSKEGVKAITDDGDSVDDARLMLQALRQAKKSNLLVICHCEDKKLSRGGSLNLGYSSTCLGLRGIPREAEFQRVARDIDLAVETEASIHIAHVSCRESVEIIAQAKKRGVAVTAETAPHYFSLSDKDLGSFDTNKKMNPPLRAKDDLLAVKQGLADGTIDIIASDHAPHTENEKDIEFERAAFGTIGLETQLAVSFAELVETKFLDWTDLLDKLSSKPAEILGVKKKIIREGETADLVIFDPEKKWIISKDNIFSKSKNSCFLGKEVKGKIEKVFARGELFSF